MSIYDSADYASVDVDERVRDSIKEAMYVYINKIQSHYYRIGVEATFKFHYAMCLEKILNLKTLNVKERFQILLEEKIKLDDIEDIVDLVIVYTCDNVEKKYLIEFKFKKISHSASDFGNAESYRDMYMLSKQKKRNRISGAYYIFLTDWQTYISVPTKKGTRWLLPMYDNAVIEANKTYNVTAESVKDEKFPNGFKFEKDYTIKYTPFKVGDKPFWFFIQEI